MLSLRNTLLKIGWPTPNPVYNILDPNGLKLLTRLRLRHSHLNQHKFKNNLKECVNPLYFCSLQVESVSYFFCFFVLLLLLLLLHCHYFRDIRKTLFNELQSVDENILNQSDHEMVELLLYFSIKFKFQQNCSILKSSIKFIIKLERFSGSLIKENISAHLYFLFVCLFICSLNLIYILKLPHTIPKVQCLCCLVFHIVFLVVYLFVIHVVCKICKSFDRKKKFCVVLVLEKYFYSKEILVSHVFCSMLLMP